MQPLVAKAPMFVGAALELLFDTRFCLPSGSSLSDDEADELASRIVDLMPF